MPVSAFLFVSVLLGWQGGPEPVEVAPHNRSDCFVDGDLSIGGVEPPIYHFTWRLEQTGFLYLLVRISQDEKEVIGRIDSGEAEKITVSINDPGVMLSIPMNHKPGTHSLQSSARLGKGEMCISLNGDIAEQADPDGTISKLGLDEPVQAVLSRKAGRGPIDRYDAWMIDHLLGLMGPDDFWGDPRMDFDRDGDFDVDDYWVFWTTIYAKQPRVNLSDVNFDGVVDEADAVAWREAYASGMPNADTNADGVLDAADAEAFGRALLLDPR